MSSHPDFKILSQAPISNAFTQRNLHTFQQAADFIQHLPYGRNADKNNLLSLFADQCGTCSTKHALLKSLANENNFAGLELVIGLFKMNAANTPKVGATLRKDNLVYLPEAHCYLKYENKILDYTRTGSKASDFVNDLIEESGIQPQQINTHKISYHQSFLKNWLTLNPQLPFSFEGLWAIREQCIADLSMTSQS